MITALQPAVLSFNENTPISSEYDDIYFSKEDGMAESRYVFIEQNHLRERWLALSCNSTPFVIIETGFGTGLNFFLAASLFLECTARPHTLHFVSFEKNPLTLEDFQKTASLFLKMAPELSPIIKSITDFYPPLITGFHRLPVIEDRVFLTLIYGDIEDCLPTLISPVHAWFLDGFSPQKNLGMWGDTLFQNMKKLSDSNTTFATFTSASFIRKKIIEAGFEVKKVKGFQKKREMLAGTFIEKKSEEITYPLSAEPWFIYAHQKHAAKTKEVLIVGAGLSGCHTAFALAIRGYKVTLIDQHEAIAKEASGNPIGLVYTHFSKPRVPVNVYYETAFFYALNFLKKIAQKNKALNWNPQGIAHIPTNKKEQEEWDDLIKTNFWKDSFIKLTAEEKKEEESEEIPPSYLLNFTGQINPKLLCSILINHPNIELKLTSKINKISYHDNLWHILNEEQVSLCAPTLVLTNAISAKNFKVTAHLPLKAIRGQLTYLLANEHTKKMTLPLNYGGYISQEIDGFHCVGATFKPKSTNQQLSTEEHEINLKTLKKAAPAIYELFELPNDFSELKGRVAFRTSTPDYLPLIGPVPNEEALIIEYAPLRTGKLKEMRAPCPTLPGLFINAGHGSRGIISSALASEIIAAYINHEPFPLEKKNLEAIHPARFLIRDLKRRKI